MPIIVGHTRQPQGFLERLHSGTSIVVFGPLGFGKTVLLDNIAERLTATSGPPIRILGTESTSSQAFGSLLSDPNVTLAEALAEASLSTGRVLGFFRHLSDASRPSVLVDDAHLLDAHTQKCLTQLVATEAITLLATSDLVTPASPTTGHNSTNRLLDALWITGRAERVDLEPISAAESADLVDVLLIDRRHGLATTPAEAQVIASSWIDDSELPHVTQKWGQPLVADILLMAARHSRSVGQPQQALVFAA